MKIKPLLVIILLIVLGGPSAKSANNLKPTYGAEFEFMNRALVNDWFQPSENYDLTEKMVYKLSQGLAELCEHSCFVNILSGGGWASINYRFTLPGGFWFVTTWDPGVVEVKTRPSTLEELKKSKNQINKYLFNHAKKIGFISHQVHGAGHFNIGIKNAFLGNPRDGKYTKERVRSFLAYFIDFINHPELATGVWMDDQSNSPVFSRRGLRVTKKVQKIIDDFDSNKIKTYRSLVSRIFDDLNYKVKYESIRIPLSLESKVANEETLEIRAAKPQRNMDEFILMAELFELRKKFLDKSSLETRYFYVSPRITDQEKINRFYLYVTDAGGQWNKFKKLIHYNFKTKNPSGFVKKDISRFTSKDFREFKKYIYLAREFPTLEKKFLSMFDSKNQIIQNYAKSIKSKLIKENKKAAPKMLLEKIKIHLCSRLF